MDHHDMGIARLFEAYDPADTDSIDHPTQFDRCHPDDQEVLHRWVTDRVAPSSRGYRSFQGTSYGLKNVAQEDIGYYVSNGGMKGAMLAAGYEPVDPSARNWRWRIRLVASSLAESDGVDRGHTRGVAHS